MAMPSMSQIAAMSAAWAPFMTKLRALARSGACDAPQTAPQLPFFGLKNSCSCWAMASRPVYSNPVRQDQLLRRWVVPAQIAAAARRRWCQPSSHSQSFRRHRATVALILGRLIFIEHADASGAVDFMARKGQEITIKCLYIQG